MIIELDINGARLIVSGDNLVISVIEEEAQGAPRNVARDVSPPAVWSPLTAWRKSFGYTQDELAQLLGVDQSFISRLENGTTSASLEDAIKIAKLSEGAVPVESLVRRTSETHALTRYRASNELTLESFGNLVGAHKSMVFHWEGGTIPRRYFIEKIQEVTGGKVTAADWYRPVEARA